MEGLIHGEVYYRNFMVFEFKLLTLTKYPKVMPVLNFSEMSDGEYSHLQLLVETSRHILPEAISSLLEIQFFRKSQTDHTSLNLFTKFTVPVFISNNACTILNPSKSQHMHLLCPSLEPFY